MREDATADESSDTLERRVAIVGLAFVALMLVGFSVGRGTPAYDAADAERVEWFADGGNRARLVIGVLAGGSCVACARVVFDSALDSDPREGRWGRDGTMVGPRQRDGTAVLITVGSLIARSMAFALTFAWNFDEVPSAELLKALELMGGSVWLVGGGWAAALFEAAASHAARGTSIWADWLVTAGHVIAPLLLLSVFIIPIVLFPLWMLVVSVVAFRRGMARSA